MLVRHVLLLSQGKAGHDKEGRRLCGYSNLSVL